MDEQLDFDILTDEPASENVEALIGDVASIDDVALIDDVAPIDDVALIEDGILFEPEFLEEDSSDSAYRSPTTAEPEYSSWNRSAPFRFIALAVAIFFGFFLLGHDLIDRFLHGPDYGRTVVNVPIQTTERFSSIAQIEEFYGATIRIDDPSWQESQVITLFNKLYDSLSPELLVILIDFYRDLGLETVFTFVTPTYGRAASVGIDENGVEFIIRGFEGPHESLVHEVGHLLHFYLTQTGQDLSATFEAINQPFAYTGEGWMDMTDLTGGREQVFVSTYATSAFAEDFAETFRFLHRWPYGMYDGRTYRDEVVAASLDPTTPLGQKAQIITDAMAQLMHNSR
jgi:hypothetical protein